MTKNKMLKWEVLVESILRYKRKVHFYDRRRFQKAKYN